MVVVKPAGTVTVDAGTGSSALLLDRATAMPPVGAALFSVTVHVVFAAEFKLVGLHARADTTTGATRLMVEGSETPLKLAVRVAL